MSSLFGSAAPAVLAFPFELSLLLLSVFKTGLTVLGRSFVGLVDGDAEALVASPPSDHVRPRAMEGHLGLDAALLCFRHGRLEALQRAGFHEAQGRAQRSTSRRLWETNRDQVGGFVSAKMDERERPREGKRSG